MHANTFTHELTCQWDGSNISGPFLVVKNCSTPLGEDQQIFTCLAELLAGPHTIIIEHSVSSEPYIYCNAELLSGKVECDALIIK